MMTFEECKEKSIKGLDDMIKKANETKELINKATTNGELFKAIVNSPITQKVVNDSNNN